VTFLGNVGKRVTTSPTYSASLGFGSKAAAFAYLLTNDNHTFLRSPAHCKLLAI
jgi:hypothetical protein